MSFYAHSSRQHGWPQIGESFALCLLTVLEMKKPNATPTGDLGLCTQSALASATTTSRHVAYTAMNLIISISTRFSKAPSSRGRQT
ncbi:protein of unknown function [Nitrospira japonica]|uniref:Uncharacterized protein n=1 Tax=Nitrospira japonica TaxID=1325564 RepID=A0A1W1IBI8_9BACT|nr:protein of unknown function [Nitrospira japonica]